MRRLENIAIVSVFPNDASLQEVLRLVASQFKQLRQPFPVLDLKNSVHESKVDAKNADRYVRAEDGQLIPFKEVVCRCSYSLGDSVNQVELGGGRTVNSTFFCSRCYTNRGTAAYRSKVHEFKKEILNFDISTYIIIPSFVDLIILQHLSIRICTGYPDIHPGTRIRIRIPGYVSGYPRIYK
jgi:hypothetical protein